MDYVLWVRDNWGYLLIGAIIAVFVGRSIYIWYKNRKVKAKVPDVYAQQPYYYPQPQQQQFQPQVQQYPQQPYGGVPPFGAYDHTAALIQQKMYIEDQLRKIESEAKIIADEINLCDSGYQQQKSTLTNKRQSNVLSYNMWKRQLDEINNQLGPQACKTVEDNAFVKMGA